MRRFMFPSALVAALALSLGLGCGKSSSKKLKPPIVTNVVPSQGDNNTTTQITITGKFFKRVVNVNLDDPANTPLTGWAVVSKTAIIATVPAGVAPGLWNVQVTNPKGTNPNSTPRFQVTVAGTPPPTVSAVNPSSGTNDVGTPVTIGGTNFLGTVTAWLEDPATTQLTGLVVGSPTSLTATVPGGIAAGTYEVRVSADGGTSTLGTGPSFTVMDPATPPPTVAAINPNTGPNNVPTAVTIDGTNFIAPVTARLDDPATTALTGVSIVSASRITATVPSGVAAGAHPVRVSAAGGLSPVSGVTFTATNPATPPPTVTGITPNTGPDTTDTNVTIDGTNFIGTVTARLDDPGTTALTNVVVVSPTQLTATVPMGVATGAHEVRVNADGGLSAPAGVLFTVTGVVYTGPAIYVTRSEGNEVDVINLTTRMYETSIPVGQQPSDIAITPDESKIYVANTTSGTLSVIDTSTNTVSTSIVVGPSPAAVDVDPTGTEVYVANSGATFGAGGVSIVDVATDVELTKVDVIDAPGELEFLRPQGTECWILTSGPAGTAIDSVDVIDFTTRVPTTIPAVGINPLGITFDAAGTTAVITNVGDPQSITAGDIVHVDVATKNITGQNVTNIFFPSEIAKVPGRDVAYYNDFFADVQIFDLAGLTPSGTTIVLAGGTSLPLGRYAFAPATDRAFMIVAEGAFSPFSFSLYTIDTALDQSVPPSYSFGPPTTDAPVSIVVKES